MRLSQQHNNISQHNQVIRHNQRNNNHQHNRAAGSNSPIQQEQDQDQEQDHHQHHHHHPQQQQHQQQTQQPLQQQQPPPPQQHQQHQPQQQQHHQQTHQHQHHHPPHHQNRYHHTNNVPPQMHHQIMSTPAFHPNQQIGAGIIRQGYHENDFPLRMLVQSDMVGAIIGRSGSTIKQIIHHSKARIDVQREESLDQQEKIITINGSPESCSSACFRIIEIVQNEKMQENRDEIATNGENSSSANMQNGHDPLSEIQLKILAHNNLIGRLIGKNGSSIKRIMEQTSTRINISANSLTECTNERTITIVGSLEQIRQAELVVSSKLRTAYMSDVSSTMQAMNQQPYLFNNVPMPYMPGPYSQKPMIPNSVNSQGGHGGPAMSRAMLVGPHQGQIPGPPLYPGSPNYISIYPNLAPPAAHGLMGSYPGLSGMVPEKETVHIYIPNSTVGAIIGKSGSAIKEMICTSGASIKVAPTQPEPTRPETPKAQETAPSQEQESSEPVQEAEEEPKHDQVNDSQQPVDRSTSSQPHIRQQANTEIHPSTRRVTVVGTPDAQWSAQYFIYRKVAMENKKSDISLMVEIQVPSNLVGKIIGKGGVTVKQIKMQTRTSIRLPEEKPSTSETENDGETSVQITGPFENSQLAQRHIRNLIKESLYSSSRFGKSAKAPPVSCE